MFDIKRGCFALDNIDILRIEKNVMRYIDSKKNGLK